MLKWSHDKGSPYLKPRMVSKGSKTSFPTLTELQELLNVILHSHYQLRKYTKVRHCGKNTIHYGALKGSFIVDKNMVYVDLFFVGLFQDRY